MLNLVSNIVITQQPTTTYPSRSNVYSINFVNDVEIKSGWKDLTVTAKIILPRNIYLKDPNSPNGLINWANQGAYASMTGNPTPPILMRGDRVSISLGYYYNPGSGYIIKTNEEFNGFITKINPKMPMEIECEDNMWLLKQAQCPNMVFSSTSKTATYKDSKGVSQTISSYNNKNWTTQNIIHALLKISSAGTNNTYLNNVLVPALDKIIVINGVNASLNIETSVGDFRTQNETIAGVLFRLRKDYKLECFFRKDITKETDSWNNLYCSGVVYYPSDFLNTDGTFNFTSYNFQQNITGGDLVYLRKDDVRLGIKAYSVSKYELTTRNSAGNLKTKNSRLEAIVGDTDGDIRTQFFWPLTNTDPDLNLETLTAQAQQRLKKLKYEGWRGDFESFGLPYVQNGQAVGLVDSILKERQGIYLVKSTTVKFGVDGFRRKIELHIRIDNQTGLEISDMINGL